MSEPKPYKPTFLDRLGPDGALRFRALVLGISTGAIMGVLTFAAITATRGWQWWAPPVALMAATFGGGFSYWLSESTGSMWKRFMVDGASTPYVEQYSYQQALVMQGRLDDALESFEAVIAEKPEAYDPRVKAAELYDRDKKNHARAAELFREAQRIPTINAGQFMYVTNRLVDLYTGPLDTPGRALVELRRLIDRYPGAPAAAHARDALATLKARHISAE